ncbi:MAG: T9SS type A sorting domain-containing protein [Saprospiraceae bacterium]
MDKHKHNPSGNFFTISLIFLFFGWLPLTSYTQNCIFDDPQKQLEYEVMLEWYLVNENSFNSLVTWRQFAEGTLCDVCELSFVDCDSLGFVVRYVSTRDQVLPENIGGLTNLIQLNIAVTGISSLPESIGNLSSLKFFSLGGNNLTALPESIGNLKSLKAISLNNNQLSSLPNSFGNLTNLTSVDLASNNLTSLPANFSQLINLTSLNLIRNNIICFPLEIVALCETPVRVLMSSNPIGVPFKREEAFPGSGVFIEGYCNNPEAYVCSVESTANCSALTFTSSNGQITISNLTPQSRIEIIGKNTNWQIVPICDGDCSETQIIPDLEAGEYIVKVQLFGADGTYCYREESVTVADGVNGAITLLCPENQSITPPVGSGSIVFFDDPTASTTCPLGGLEIKQIEGLPSGSGFGIGIKTISYSVTDACGNETTCSFRIIVGETQPVTLRGIIFNDLNGNGFKENNEPNLPNVSIRASNGATSGTNFDGEFAFTSGAGDYQLTIETPIGFKPTIQTGQVRDDIANDSDIDPLTGMTETFFMGSSERIETISAGFVALDNTTANCEALAFTTNEDRINITGLTPQSKVEYLGRNTGYQVITICDGNCPTNGGLIPNLTAGEYTVKVQLFGEDGSYCYREEKVNVGGGGNTGGKADCDNLTFTNDNGQITVSGLNAIYNKVEIIGRNTDYQVVTICDGNCSDTQVIPNLDAGEYSVKINQSGSDGSYCYREEKVNIEGGGNTGEKANCDNLTFTGENGQITVDGLTATQDKVEIIGRNTNYQVITICDGNCSETQIIPDLMAGEYAVKVNQSGSDGSYCYREEKISLQSTSSSRTSNKIYLATYQKAQNVQLQWAVSSIEETSYFLIERSFDGATFEPLTLLANVAKDYTFQWTDEHPKTGENHYRVRQIFYNNATLYSTVQSEEFFLKAQEITLFPNPTKDLLNVHSPSLKGKTGTIQIYSIFGQQVAQYNNITFEENLQTIAVNDLENGLYWLTLKADNTRVISKRFVVERLR